jgi:hypothetical protein
MSALEGEGVCAGKPGEPLRRVGGESKDAFVGVNDLGTAVGGEGDHGNGTRGGAGWRRGIKDGRKGSRNEWGEECWLWEEEPGERDAPARAGEAPERGE